MGLSWHARAEDTEKVVGVNSRLDEPVVRDWGQKTDDTSMALAESTAEVGWDLNDQARRYVAWWREGKYSVNGRWERFMPTLRERFLGSVTVEARHTRRLPRRRTGPSRPGRACRRR